MDEMNLYTIDKLIKDGLKQVFDQQTTTGKIYLFGHLHKVSDGLDAILDYDNGDMTTDQYQLFQTLYAAFSNFEEDVINKI